MKINRAAIDKAKTLIQHQQYVLDSEWSKVQPTTDQENTFLKEHDWEEYGKWFLGEHTDQDQENKGRYGFPYGDFRRVHRSGLIAAKQRAAQNNHLALEQEVDTLLTLLDQKKA